MCFFPVFVHNTLFDVVFYLSLSRRSNVLLGRWFNWKWPTRVVCSFNFTGQRWKLILLRYFSCIWFFHFSVNRYILDFHAWPNQLFWHSCCIWIKYCHGPCHMIMNVPKHSTVIKMLHVGCEKHPGTLNWKRFNKSAENFCCLNFGWFYTVWLKCFTSVTVVWVSSANIMFCF